MRRLEAMLRRAAAGSHHYEDLQIKYARRCEASVARAALGLPAASNKPPCGNSCGCESCNWFQMIPWTTGLASSIGKERLSQRFWLPCQQPPLALAGKARAADR